MVEAGYKDRYWGKPEREMLSEADKIPVVMIGEPVDPDGKGAASNDAIYLNCPQETLDSFGPEHPWHGLTTQQVAESMLWQMQMERLNVRVLLVADPEDKGRDEMFRDIVQQVVDRVSEEQQLDYSDLRVCLVKDLLSHLGEGKTTASTEDVRKCFFPEREP